MTARAAVPPTRVIYYHCVGQPMEGGGPNGRSDRLTTPPEHLEAHIALLRGLGYRFATAGGLAGLWRGSTPPPCIAVLTFDDGGETA